ncbi:MAG: Gfo/Idh/MocA family oxidoreductase [Nitrososphaerota archaeon]|nr:Gfo/Idh/MocA family oxidoreductase [Nitrososphaerota archaeon]
MKTVRVGVVGLGWFGEKHLQILSQLPNVEVVAVCSRTKSRAEEIAKRYGVKTAYTEWDRLAGDSRIDAVTVATHLPDHRKPVIACVEAGKDVFVEKPIAPTLKDADAMIAAARRAKVSFMVGHILRFENRYAQAKVAVDVGRVGKVVSIYARRNIPASFAAPHLSYAPALVLDAVHDTDLMLWYTGKTVENVYATFSKVGEVKNPDVCWGVYNFEGGAKGVCETVWVLRDNTPFSIDARMEILGTEGAIYIDSTENGLLINDRDGTKRPDTVHWPVLHGWTTGALRDEVEYWIRCVANGVKPEVCTPADARNALEVVLAAEDSSKKGRVVELRP